VQMLWQVSQSHYMVYAERLRKCGRLDCRLFLTVLNVHPLSECNWK